MQQWECHIQGLDNIFGAREVEKLGRQIDGVVDIRVDFARESLILEASSVAVLSRLEKRLALSGHKLHRKNYLLTSAIQISDLASDISQRTVRDIMASHAEVIKFDIRPFSQVLYVTHDGKFLISEFLCELNNRGVSANLKMQSYQKNRWPVLAKYMVVLAIIFFFAAALMEILYRPSEGTMWLYILSLVITGSLLTKRVFTQVFLHRKLTYGFLMLSVVLLSISQNLWFESALLGLSLAVGALLEARVSQKLKGQWGRLRSSLPLFAFQKKQNMREAVPIDRIMTDDVLIVNAGEYVPVDGVISQGEGTFSANNIVANSEMLKLKSKDKVFAGYQLINGEIEMKVVATARHSMIQKLFRRLENLQTKITPKQKNIAKNMNYLLYGFLFVSLIFFSTQYFSDAGLPAIWVEKTLALLVISGSAYVLTSLQFSYLFSYLYAAKNGLYFYEPSIWNEMAKVKSLVLDQENVITNHQPEVQHVISFERHSTQEIFSLAASLAAASDCFRFKPIQTRAISNGATLLEISSVLKSSSKLISAEVNGEIFTLGSRQAITDMGLLSKKVIQKLKRWQGEGENGFLLANETTVLGMVIVADPVREDVGDFMEFCRYLGIENIHLMSSDNEDVGENLVNRYGFKQVFSELSQTEKTACLKNFAGTDGMMAISNDANLSIDGKVSILNNGLMSKFNEKNNQIISLGKNLILLPYLFQVSRRLDTRMSRLIRLLVNVKIIILLAIFFNVMSFSQVIMAEFLLAVYVLSTTYRPKDMFVDVPKPL